jgi:hypothetical protein
VSQFDQDKGPVEAAAEEAHNIHWYDFWKHKLFWTRHAPVTITIMLFVLGISMLIWKRDTRVAFFGVLHHPSFPFLFSRAKKKLA